MFFSFLRAINVGGHNVKMDHLKQIFETMGFSNVETFIASGNVIFSSPEKNAATLEKKIEKKLKEVLGYEVATFIRTEKELAVILNYLPFPQPVLDKAMAFNIAFLSETPTAAALQKLNALKNEIDDFHVHGRELYWICKVMQSDSKFSNVVLEKTLGMKATFRGAKTLQKLGAKYLKG